MFVYRSYRFCATDSAEERCDNRNVLCHSDEDAMTLAANLTRDYVRVEVWFGKDRIGSACHAPANLNEEESSPQLRLGTPASIPAERRPDGGLLTSWNLMA